jgi:hypothetical protein
MFQQSIPRLLLDFDIATYKGQFILIDDQTGQFLSKAVILVSIPEFFHKIFIENLFFTS